MATTTPVRANPYIGPRSFETGEKLFGRDRELRDLLHLLIAERVVLLYSPSGAGKSSLIKAALLPALARKAFVALPPIRVNQELPPDAPPQANRYVYSTLLSLEDRRRPEQRLPLASLASLSLPDYLLEHILPEAQAAEADPVLIFDQFEEVLTVEPTSLAAKHAFFEQLGAVLGDRRLWALIAMREDFLAALDPYLEHLPTRFKDTFRLDLLGVDAARQAMHGPAQAAGVTFAPEAAAALADELRRTAVQRPDGSVERVLGPYVEPVQLQVVCLRLWDKLFGQPAARAPLISPDDIADVGDVDSALADYYVDRIRAVAAATGVGERDIRDWFDRELITAQGQRGQVMREAGQSAGLDNTAILGLIDAHLLRADERHGIVWYELAHDRLVGPVQQSNAAWRSQHLSAFQRQALLWEEQQRAEGLLIQADALAEAERWAEANAAALTESERAFLEASRKARAQREEEARTARLMRRRLIVAMVAGALAIGLALFSLNQYRGAEQARRDADGARQAADTARTTAEQQTRIARVRQLAAQAAGALQQHPQRSLLLAAASQQVLKTGDPAMPAEQAIVLPLVYGLGGAPLPDASTAFERVFSPDGHWLAARGEDGHAWLWRASEPARTPFDLGRARALTISADGRWLATLDHAGTARLWHLSADTLAPVALAGQPDDTAVLALSPDGRWLATSSLSSTLRLWRLDTPAPALRDLGRQPLAVSELSFSPDGQALVLRDGSEQAPLEDRPARLWRLAGTQPSATDLGLVTRPVFSPDGRWLATAGQSAGALLWRLDPERRDPTDLQSRVQLNQPPLFSADGRWLGLIDSDQQPRLWRIDADAPVPVTLELPASDPRRQPATPDSAAPARPGLAVEWLGLSPDGRQVIAFCQDGMVRRWRTDAARPAAEELGPAQDMLEGVFSADSRWLVASGRGGQTQLWPLAATQAIPIELGERVRQFALSPDGGWLATATDALGTLELWQLDTNRPVRSTLRGHEHFVTTLAFSPDGRQLVSFSEQEHARLWQTVAPLPAKISLSQEQPGLTVSFSPNSRWAATTDLSGTLRLWRVEGLAAARLDLGAAGQGVAGALFSPDGRWLLGYGAQTRLWRLDQAAPTASELERQTVAAAAFSPDARWLITSEPGAPARLWRLDGATPAPARLDQPPAGVSAPLFSPDARWLTGQTADGSVRLWRLDGTGPTPVELPGVAPAGSIALSPDGRWLSIKPERAAPSLWDLSQPSPARSALDPQARGDTLLAFSPAGRWLALDSADGSAWLQPLGQPADQAVRLGAGISRLVFSPDGHRLVTSDAAQIALWQLDGPQPSRQTLDRHSEPSQLDFSPDGRWLCAAYHDGTIKAWRLSAADQPAIEISGRVRTDSDQPAQARFSADGTWLATSALGTPTQLWLLDDQQAVAIALNDAGQQGGGLSFSPDGRWLTTSSADGTTLLWLVSQSDLSRLFCATAGRNLGADEWQQIGGPQLFSKVCPFQPYHPSMYQELLAQRKIALALGGHATDRLLGVNREPQAAWLVRMASALSASSPQSALLAYTVARQLDPRLQGVSAEALKQLCLSVRPALPGPPTQDVCARARALMPTDADLTALSTLVR